MPGFVPPKPSKPPTLHQAVVQGRTKIAAKERARLANVSTTGARDFPVSNVLPKRIVPKRVPVKAPAKLSAKAKPQAGPGVRVPPPSPVRNVPVGSPAKGHPKITPKSVAAPPPTASTDTGGLSGFDEYLQASLAPALQQIDYLRQQQQMSDQRRIAAIRGLTNQFLGYINTVPSAVQADYGSAIATQRSLGEEAMHALTAANPNAQTQADLQAVGAPASQQQAVTDQNNATFAGGGAVLFGTGGQIPANRLAANEASQLAFVRSLPAIASAQGQKTLQNYLLSSQQSSNDLNQQLAQLYAGIPKMRLEYQSAQQSNLAKQQQLDLEYRALGLKTNNQSFNQGLAVQKLGISKASLSLRALQADRSWQATLQRLGIADAQLKISAAKAQAQLNGGGYTTSQRLGLQKRAGKVAADAYNGVPVKKSGQVIGYNHLTYQHAMSDMLAQGIPLTIAQQALNTYWSKPGYIAPFEVDPATHHQLPGAGRPLYSYQQRQAKKKGK